MGSEDLYIKNIKNGIRGIRLGTRTPQEANVGSQFTKLKPLNEGMYEELMGEYKKVVADYNLKNPK